MVLLFNEYKKKCAVSLTLKRMATSSLDSPKCPTLWRKSMKFGRRSALATLEIHLSLVELQA